MSRGVKKPDPPHKMEFATNSLRNTTIAVENDQYYFEVVTRFWHPTITKINRFDVNTGNLTTVAEIERLTSREPKVRFLQSSEKGTGLGEWMKASEFVKYENNRLGGTFNTNDGTSLRWKTHNRKLRLVNPEDDKKQPIVQYHSHERFFWILRMTRHAWLEIKPELTDSLEKVIVSYLLVERRRRNKTIRIKGF